MRNPRVIRFRGAAYRLRFDPIERDAKRIIEQVVLQELRKDVAATGEDPYQEIPFKPTSWYVEKLTPEILATIQQEGYDQNETERLRSHVEDHIIKMVEKVWSAYSDLASDGAAYQEDDYPYHQGAAMTPQPKQVKFRGAVYRLAQHPHPRLPIPKTFQREPPDYEWWKRCILSPVPEAEEKCDKLNKMRAALKDLTSAASVLGISLENDDARIMGVALYKIMELFDKLEDETNDLQYLGQKAHTALKSMHP